MPKRNDNQGYTNYVCFKCHNLSIPNDRILRNFQRICQKIVFSPTVLTKSLGAISQSEQIMHITVDSPKPKLSTFSFFYLSTRRFTANVQRAYPRRIDFRDNNNHKLLKLPFIQFQNCSRESLPGFPLLYDHSRISCIVDLESNGKHGYLNRFCGT